MRIGPLRHRVTIQQTAETQNDYGETNNTWSEYVKRWADVRQLRGQEALLAEQTQSRTTHRVRMRHVSGLTSKMRIKWGARILNINGIQEDRTHQRETVVMCTEDTN